MAALTAFSLDDAHALFAAYDYEGSPPSVTALEAVYAGTVNSSYSALWGGHRRFIRIYEEQGQDGAVAEAQRLEVLASRGVRTPPPLARRDGSFVGVAHGKPVVVFPWRDGSMRCLARVTAADTLRLGRALAELHVAAMGLPGPPGRFEVSHLETRLERIAGSPYPAISMQAAPLRASLGAWSARRDTTLPRGLVHGDVFRDNVLWKEDGEISALLDFESASEGTFAYDLMVTMLAWSFRDGLEVDVARALVQGYETVRPLTARECSGLLAEACSAAVRFAVTRLTDSELRAAEAGVPARHDKDWRRFVMRLGVLESLGEQGLARALGLAR